MSAPSVRLLLEEETPWLAPLLEQQIGRPAHPGLLRPPAGAPIVAAGMVGEQLVAHYTVFPQRLVRDDLTAVAFHGGPYTMPEHRGQGYYAALTTLLFAELRRREAVHIGFPNAVSMFLERAGVVPLSALSGWTIPTSLRAELRDTEILPGEELEEIDSSADEWLQLQAPAGRISVSRNAARYRWLRTSWIDFWRDGARSFFLDFRTKTGERRGLALCRLIDSGETLCVLDLAGAPECFESLLGLIRRAAAERGAAAVTLGTSDDRQMEQLLALGGRETKRSPFWVLPGANDLGSIAHLVASPWSLSMLDQLIS